MHVGFGMFLTVIVCVSLSLLSCLPCMLIFYAFTLNVTGSNTCQLLLKTVNVSIALLHRDGAEKSDKAPAYLMAVGGHAVKSVDPLASLAKQLGGSKRNALLKWCQNRTATYTVCIEIYHTTPHSMMIVHRGHVAWTSVWLFLMYTMSQKSRPLLFYDNFGKCGSNFHNFSTVKLRSEMQRKLELKPLPPLKSVVTLHCENYTALQHSLFKSKWCKDVKLQ